VRLLKKHCEDLYRVVAPQINAEGVHVWPFDPAFPIDVRFLLLGRRHNVRMNRHDFFELIYVFAGSADLQIHERTLLLGNGDLAVIGSTLYHRLVGRRGPPLTVAVLFFKPDLIRAEGPDGCEYLMPFHAQDENFPHVIPAQTGVPGEVFDLMQRIRAGLATPGRLAQLAVKTYLKMILILLVKQYSSYPGTVQTFQRQQHAQERLRPLFEHLDRHDLGPIAVSQAARICGMSESHFMNCFKGATGQTFMAYLNHCRIERAGSLLVGTDKRISEISQELGFCDQSYFGVAFKKLVGMTPAAYRRKFQDTALTNGEHGAVRHGVSYTSPLNPEDVPGSPSQASFHSRVSTKAV
jgi:AraC-like DNA-binding protein